MSAAIMDTYDMLKAFGPYLLAGYGTVILIKEKVTKSEETEKDLKISLNTYSKEFQTFVTNANLAIEKQALVLKMFENTMTSIVNKIEKLEERLNKQDVEIALLKDKQ